MAILKFALIVLAARALVDVASGVLWSESSFAQSLMQWGIGPNTIAPLLLAVVVLFYL